MSTRRLAAEQPDSFAFSAESEKVRAILGSEISGRPQGFCSHSAALGRAEAEGWVSEPSIRYIAQRLGMARIRVLEVATFYTMFHLAPVGRHHIAICGTTPCMLRGARIAARRLQEAHQPAFPYAFRKRQAVVGRDGMSRRLRERADGRDR